jgi:hypothetical protein
MTNSGVDHDSVPIAKSARFGGTKEPLVLGPDVSAAEVLV